MGHDSSVYLCVCVRARACMPDLGFYSQNFPMVYILTVVATTTLILLPEGEDLDHVQRTEYFHLPWVRLGLSCSRPEGHGGARSLRMRAQRHSCACASLPAVRREI